MFSPSLLSASTLRSVLARIMICQCIRSSAISVVIWFLAISSFTRSRHLRLGMPRFLFPSTSICNIFLVALYLYLLCTFPNQPSQSLLTEEFRHRVHVCRKDVYISHMVLSRLYSCPTQHAHFSCVQFPLLLLSNCPTFCTIHHGQFHSRLVHFVFQLCWYVPVEHHPSSLPPF